MNNDHAIRYRLQNWLHTILLLVGMLFLLSLIGWLISGVIGVLWALSMGVVLILIITKLSPYLILFLYGAQPVAHNQLNQIRDIITWLTNRSHLPQPPGLYYIPSSVMLAFSVGMRKDTAIAVSDGLLRELTAREMAAVLAHEISHIKSKDLWVMAIADAISRITSVMALTGYLMIIVYLPFYTLQGEDMPWLLLLLLVASPYLSALMQLALSRTREFNADLQAVKLTGDSQGLISSLRKIEQFHKNWIEKLLLPGRRAPYPSLLRTHPHTEERIRRLDTVARHEHHPIIHDQQIYPVHNEMPQHKPRQHISGLWH